MDGPRDFHTIEIIQIEKGKYHMISLISGIKYDTNELIFKTKADSQTQRTDWWLPMGRGWGSDGLGGWALQVENIAPAMDATTRDGQQGPTVQHRDYI